MAVSSVVGMWFWMLLLAGGGSLPVGGAPLPLDPQLSAIAPPECLWYAAYAGQGEADAASGNQTEQLFAEPEVRRLANELRSQIFNALQRAGTRDPRQRVVVEHAPKLVEALLTRPYAVYVEELKPRDGGADVSAAFVLNAGDQREGVERAIEELLKLAPPEAAQFSTESVAGVEWRRAATPPEAPVVRYGWKGDYLIIAVGEETPAKLVERMDGAAPAWLTEIRQEHPIERELSIGYLNVAGLLERIRPVAEANDPKAWPAIEKLGLTSIRAIHGISGYDDVACKTVGHVVTDGELRGVLGFLPHKPLSKDDLRPIPQDALLAFAASVDFGDVWNRAVKLAGEFEPGSQAELDRALMEIETNLGIDLQEDVIQSLDDAAVIYLPGGDLMSSWLNSAAAIKVANRDKLADAVEKLVDVAQAEMRQQPNRGEITESTVSGSKLYSLRLPNPAPISPSWSVGEDWLVFALSPQAARAALERDADASLAEAPGIAEALEAEGGASLISYQDTPKLVRSVYPWLQIGLQMASGELRKQGIELDTSALPTVDVIVKHLSPGIGRLSHQDDGFHFTSRHSLPGQGNLAAGAPIAVALVLPAIQSARQAARTAQETNNLKQLALAFHNYVDANKAFPTNVYSDDGKPLLSWRVRLLPYLEEAALYEQFNLDEPWDSEHNKALAEKMPAVFASPGDPGLAPGKTRYVALAGDETLFPGDERLWFAEVTDGTSNTILFVQAAPGRAVEWTKPADLEFDADKPFAGLETPRGEFLAAFCDGSVHRISLGIAGDTMKALATRAGGEVIGQEELNAPPRPVAVGAP